MSKALANGMKLMTLLLLAGIIGCSPSHHTQTYAPDTKQESNNTAPTWVKLDTVKAGKFDTGRMWTFDFPPKDHLKAEYDFHATDEWLDNVRMAALRFANYCSASFVSEDGLIMTNHHCARQSITSATRDGEDLHGNGFWAPTLADERKIEGLYVDQLVEIKDITSEMQAAIDAGTTQKEKDDLKKAKSKELEEKYAKETGLKYQTITLFNGGKYSLYGFKRYTDIRLVFAPEEQMGFFGGDPDNFTYPRYNLDYTFFRAYDDKGEPIKSTHFYKWSTDGPKWGEPIFVVGNPGTTNRLKTVAQLEYFRDIAYPLQLEVLGSLAAVYGEMIAEYPERELELSDQYFGIMNSQKAFNGILGGLRDPYLMQKKYDFEKNFKNEVMKKPALSSYYGLWDSIKAVREELRTFAKKSFAYNLNPNFTSKYFFFAKALIDLAKEMKKPEDERQPMFKGDMLQKYKDNLWPEKFDKPLSDKQLQQNIRVFQMVLGNNDPLVTKLSGGKTGKAAADYALANAKVTTKEGVLELANKSPEEILSSNDPFIQYVLATFDQGTAFMQRSRALNLKESDYNQQLGRALFEVYGTSIPPDATFSLRISDGVLKKYNYNGTTAPVFTTFFGLYDRYYSHEGKFPWNLPEKWVNPPAELDLETPMNFVATNDIIGGNSGSAMINSKGEVVGIAFDGNIESLPGQFIFDETANRTVAVHSSGIYESVADVYKATRLANELKNGKMNPADKTKTDKQAQ
ncbi:MAG: S46 family peptidase [Ignavibacteriales bacterium]|nr:MAG: S46 family peptidase [Ignavibacteriales bacterium]